MQHHPSQTHWLETVPIRKRAHFEPDDLIADRRDIQDDTLYLVLQGSVRAMLLAKDGRERVLVYLPQGSLFGEQAALSHTKLQAELIVRAETGCEIGYLSTVDIVEAVRHKPELIIDIMRITAEKTSLFLQEIERSAFGTAQMQIATILLTLSQGERCLALTQERLAHLAGLTRVTVGAQLHQLERVGAVRLDRSKIVVLRPDLLTALSQTHDE